MTGVLGDMTEAADVSDSVVHACGLRWVCGPTTGWANAAAPYAWAVYLPGSAPNLRRRVAGWAQTHAEGVRAIEGIGRASVAFQPGGAA